MIKKQSQIKKAFEAQFGKHPEINGIADRLINARCELPRVEYLVANINRYEAYRHAFLLGWVACENQKRGKK